MSDKKKRTGGARLQKKERKPRTRKETIRMAVILAVVILLAVLLVLFAVYRGWAKPPDVQNQNPNHGGTGSGTGTSDADKAVDGVETGGDRKKDFYTFLVLGRDTGGGGNTDTILLAAYDAANQKLNVMSIPRDTMVNIDRDIKRINAVYNYAGGGDKGVDALYTEVSQLVGFVPDYEVVVEWKAVGELVDAIDGVWFDVPRRMDFWDPTQNLRIDVQKGYQLLDGEGAMGVIRWRQNNDGTGYVTGDIGRIETQQAFLKAVVAQCLKIENVGRIRELAKVFTDNVQTDLTLGNLAWFAEQAIFDGLTMENVNFITLPGNNDGKAWSRYYKSYQSYVLPDAEKLLAVINEGFNPYSEPRRMDQLDIMSVNADGSLSSSTGRVEDEKATLPPVIPTPKPEPTEDPDPEATDDPTVDPNPGVTDDPAVDPDPGVTDDPAEDPDPGVTDDPAEGPDPVTPPEETPGPEPSEVPGEGSETPPPAETQNPTDENDPETPEETIPLLPPMHAAEPGAE